ncbi:MAG: HD domain-containing protein [Anaerolineae bacterium]
MLEAAIRLAVQAHAGQLDRSGAPYILHPLRVMLAVEGEVAQMAAVLHDVVEDTPVTLEDLRQAGFPPAVVDAVDHLTRRPDEPYEAFIARIKPHALARLVKREDLRDNMNLLRLRTITPRDLERLQRYRAAWDALAE